MLLLVVLCSDMLMYIIMRIVMCCHVILQINILVTVRIDDEHEIRKVTVFNLTHALFIRILDTIAI